MQFKRRKGNLLITVLVFIMLTLTMGSMFTLNVGLKTASRNRARTAGDTQSYIALANLCADAFKDDLEAQSVRIVNASVENPDGTTGEDPTEEIGLEVYNQALSEMQVNLCRLDNGTDAWYHHLTNPMEAMEYAGLVGLGTGQHATTQLANRLLNGKAGLGDATVEIRVRYNGGGKLTASGGLDGESGGMQSGDNIAIDNIYYTVTLRKGTWTVEQNYCLQNERLTGRVDPSLIIISVDGADAENQLLSQTVTKNSKD